MVTRVLQVVPNPKRVGDSSAGNLVAIGDCVVRPRHFVPPIAICDGPTDTADAKLYMKKQIQPRKFMIRQIRGEAKKVGDTV